MLEHGNTSLHKETSSHLLVKENEVILYPLIVWSHLHQLFRQFVSFQLVTKLEECVRKVVQYVRFHHIVQHVMVPWKIINS